MANSFTFIGKIKPVKEGFFEEKSYPSGWVRRKIKFQMLCDNNLQFVEVQGGKWKDDSKNEVKTFSKAVGDSGGEKITIPWNERMNEEQIARVAYFRRFILDMTNPSCNGPKLEMISAYDFVEALRRVLENKTVDVQSLVFKVTGNVEFNYSADKNEFYRTFSATNISVVNADEKQYSHGNIDLYFHAGSLDDQYEAERGKSDLKSYTTYYNSAEKRNYFLPFDITFRSDADVSGKSIVKLCFDKKKIYKLPVCVNFVNAAQKNQMTPEMAEEKLSDQQKTMIALGIMTINDVIRDNAVYGQTITENRWAGVGRGGSNGPEETAYTFDDLSKKPTGVVSSASEQQNVEEKPKADSAVDKALFDLFG